MAYADLADLYALGLPAGALDGVVDADKASALEAASRLADSYLAAAGYAVPLAVFGDDLRRAVAAIAAYDLMAVRGFAPEGVDENLRLRYEDALRWLELVARGRARLSGVAPRTPWGAPRVHSQKPRGW